MINECLVNKLQEIRKYKFYNSIRRLKFLCSCIIIIIFLQTFFEHSIPIKMTISVSTHFDENFSLMISTLYKYFRIPAYP